VTPIEIGLVGFVALTVLIYAGVHISTALLAIAFIGTWMIRADVDAAGTMLALAATDAVADYEFGTVPLFVMMGFFVMVAGVGRDAYTVAHRALHRVPGGLAQATVIGNAIFSAITGITVAAVVLFTKIAVPEMLDRGYHPRLAVGVVAGSAMLGMLIPPSVLMIVYAVITETSIGDLYNAGIVPGIVLTAVFCGAIWLIAKARPALAGLGVAHASQTHDRDARGLAAQLLPIVALILLVLGGMYGGIFTATEAGAVGATGALVIALARRALDGRSFLGILIDTGYVTASLVLIIASAIMFSRFLAISGLPAALSAWVTAMQFGLLSVTLVYVLTVLALGTAMDSTSTILISVPVFAPILKDLGGDLIWIGVITMIAVEIGLITPPLGMSPFVVKSALGKGALGSRISLHDIYVGASPFAIAALVVVGLIIAFPSIATLTIR
jgi:C4-dicarboxylate transporter DctM subunit